MLETRDIIVLVCGQCSDPLEQGRGLTKEKDLTQLWCSKCQMMRHLPKDCGEVTLVKGRIDICLLANVPVRLVDANLKPEAIEV